MQIRDFRAGTIGLRLPNWVGDAVMSTAAIRSLAASLEGGRIVGIGSATIARLLGNQPGLDRFVVVPKRADQEAERAFTRQLAEAELDLAILLPHSFSSAWALFRRGVRRLAGWATLERRCLLHHAPWPPRLGWSRVPRPMPHHYQDLLGTLGVRTTGDRLELTVEEEHRASARERLSRVGIAPGERYFCVNPGASFGPSKRWTTSGFARVIQELERRCSVRSVVLCGPGEEAEAREIVAAAGPGAVDVSDPVFSLGELKAVLQNAHALVTTDAGPRHIATAFGVPVVVVMGSTDSRYTDCNLERTRVLRVGVECSPCHHKVCPIDHRCMTRLPAEWVLQAVEDLTEGSTRDRESVHA